MVCEKCYLMRILLFVLAFDEAKALELANSVEVNEDRRKAADTRVFRETLNTMIKKLPVNYSTFNVPIAELLINHWS